jgi:3-hydroxypropanoate dehydrogenase
MQNITLEDTSISTEALNQIFLSAHTHHGWQDRPVATATLQKLYNLIKWAPTCVNGSPMRVIFIQSQEEKEKLLPCLLEKNAEKTLRAPVTAIIAHDLEWYEHLGKLSPHFDYKPLFANNKALSDETALRNSSLQGAYLMIGARGLGLDVGPMSGFNAAMVNDIFFKNTSWQANFLCNLGYGDKSKLHPRAPRLEFEEACRII